VWVAAPIIIGGCGNSQVGAPKDASPDASSIDSASPADLVAASDLAASPDVATPDLSSVPPDLAIGEPDLQPDLTLDCAAIGLVECGAACVDTSSDINNCGTCGHACGGGQPCIAGLCECPAGQALCARGCADTSSDPINCHGCGKACEMTNSLGATCGMNGCTYTGCNPGFADCMNLAPDYDGCETPTNTVNNCGGCGSVCDIGNANSASCDGTQCSYVCKNGFADCIMIGANTDGCETPTNAIANCTGCGKMCDGTNSVGATCDGTTCSYTGCKAGFADCSMGAPDLDGCETNLNTSITGCGGCGIACDVVTSDGATCAGGCCMYTGCKMGFANCVTTCPDLNGCETATVTVNNCGGCNNVCDVSNATGASCDGVKCSYTCKTGFADCLLLGADTDGCETATTTTTNCGGCGNLCLLANAGAATCSGTRCSYNCNSGFGDCIQTGADTDGCETNLNTTAAYCGSCFASCDTVFSTGAMCNGGACSYTGCVAGWKDCVTAPPDYDGCETATNTVNNCGGCNNVCDLSNATGASCDGVKCSYTCKTGFADCILVGANTDGCETATTTPTNCGGCGNTCDTLHSLGAACNGTMCTYTACVNGWVDCDRSGANANGCESQIHINGIGQTFSDCADPIGTPGNAGTYNVNMATLARAAWIITSPSDTAINCNLGQDNCVARGNSSTCSVWCYSGPDAGYVHTNNATACVCPVAGGDVTWY
jgi:hypothetical protein